MSNPIIELWKTLPGKFFCISTKDGNNKWRDHFFTPDEFHLIKGKVQDEWADRNIYFCPHGFNRRERQKGNAVMPNILWADLDAIDPREIDFKPTIAIESSPGRYVGLWVLTDKKQLSPEVNESLNRRMTYHVGCDKGGWDITQVLRYPGTRNFKYPSQPRVRTLWDDGKKYSSGKLERSLREDPHAKMEVADGELDPVEVYGIYEKKLPRWVRRELIALKMNTRLDRSEMLWKLENECLEVGMDEDEVFAVIKNCVWNKFAGRRNEDQQLRNEISKARDAHFRDKSIKKKPTDKSDEDVREEDDPNIFGRFKLIPMKDVQREEVDWLVYPYFARGEITIVEGDPGLGKSYMVQMMAGAIATGKELPHPTKGKQKVKGNIHYFDFENAMGSVTKPRLEDNGFVNLTKYFQHEVPFGIDDDEAMEEVYELLRAKKPKLLVFDTLNTYIGRADTHKAAETVQAFNLFKQLARDFNCAVVVIRHLTKAGGSAINRGQGSIAFTGTARIVIAVGIDPNDSETRVACIVKNNLTKAPPGLSFSIEERKKGRSAFIWGEWLSLTAQEVLDASATNRAEGKAGEGVQEAMEFLEQNIMGVEMDRDKLYRLAEKRGIAKKMIDRAAGRMGVKHTKKGKLGTETWILKRKDRKPEADEE